MSTLIREHVQHTTDHWPETIGVPMFICPLGRMLGMSERHAKLLPVLYGFQHRMFFTPGEYTLQKAASALAIGMQCSFICEAAKLY